MKKLLTIIFAGLMGGFMLLAPAMNSAPVFAEEKCYDGAILDVCDDGKGSGISDVLKMVVRIMTVGIGILAIIGITVAGVQYLTAGDKEEQVRKSKRRIVEIIIGIAVFALLYAILSWLLPDFSPSSIWS